MTPKPVAERFTSPASRSLFPSRSEKLDSEAVRSPYCTPKPPVEKLASRMKSMFSTVSGPPVEPCEPKWLMFGTSSPSTRKRFSYGAPPRTARSLRPPVVIATPGKSATARTTSSCTPGARRTSSALRLPVLVADSTVGWK